MCHNSLFFIAQRIENPEDFAMGASKIMGASGASKSLGASGASKILGASGASILRLGASGASILPGA